VNELSASTRLGSAGMNTPNLNVIPKKSAPSGIGEMVAFVSGPRTVRYARSGRRVTTISHWVAATEMNLSTGSLRVRQIRSTSGESPGRVSNAKTLVARCTLTSPRFCT
jgi:hypothetical protein